VRSGGLVDIVIVRPRSGEARVEVRWSVAVTNEARPNPYLGVYASTPSVYDAPWRRR
jgi:hypothetical protein